MLGDLLVGHALDNQVQDFMLALGQQFDDVGGGAVQTDCLAEVGGERQRVRIAMVGILGRRLLDDAVHLC